MEVFFKQTVSSSESKSNVMANLEAEYKVFFFNIINS